MTERTFRYAATLTPVAAPLTVTENERAWIEFLRLASCDSDPAPTLSHVQFLQAMFRRESRDVSVGARSSPDVDLNTRLPSRKDKAN